MARDQDREPTVSQFEIGDDVVLLIDDTAVALTGDHAAAWRAGTLSRRTVLKVVAGTVAVAGIAAVKAPLALAAASTLNSLAFTADGTFTVPAHTTLVLFTLVGAGGGGGSTLSSGGSGGTLTGRINFPDSASSTTVHVVIGAGGNFGIAGGASGFSKGGDPGTGPSANAGAGGGGATGIYVIDTGHPIAVVGGGGGAGNQIGGTGAGSGGNGSGGALANPGQDTAAGAGTTLGKGGSPGTTTTVSDGLGGFIVVSGQCALLGRAHCEQHDAVDQTGNCH